MNTRSQRSNLSPSKIAMFEQCPKRLWLSEHHPELGDQNEGVGPSFNSDDEVRALTRRLMPGGKRIEADPDLRAAVETTRGLLDNGYDRPIFAAALEHDGVIVRIDILEPTGNGAWRIVEVKSSTRSKRHYLSNVATILWVADNSQLTISSAAIRHIDSSFVLESEGEYIGLFKDTEIKADLTKVAAKRIKIVRAARSVVANAEPDTQPGFQCNAPVTCEFVGYCHASLPPEPDWPVTVLPHGGGKRWLAQNVTDLLTINPEDLTNELQRRVHQATTTGEPFHDVEGARLAMAGWAYPRTWLDFETIAFAVPRWIGTRPYQQVPFQFSAHVETIEGALDHGDFLSIDGADPRRPCAEALVKLIPLTGAVIAYNASFEKRCILELATNFPDLKGELSSIADRLVDLLPVTRANWYHRDQRGSWSIKAVLPTVDPGLNYDGLDVRDGKAAQLAYLESVSTDTTADRRQVIDQALRAYCGRDTQAMIAVASRLCRSR